MHTHRSCGVGGGAVAGRVIPGLGRGKLREKASYIVWEHFLEKEQYIGIHQP